MKRNGNVAGIAVGSVFILFMLLLIFQLYVMGSQGSLWLISQEVEMQGRYSDVKIFGGLEDGIFLFREMEGCGRFYPARYVGYAKNLSGEYKYIIICTAWPFKLPVVHVVDYSTWYSFSKGGRS